MAKVISVATVTPANGGLHVVLTNTRGIFFASKPEVQAVIDNAERAITEELLIALAIKRAGGADSAALIAGRTITLTLDVSLS
jgi:hypothetical protein